MSNTKNKTAFIIAISAIIILILAASGTIFVINKLEERKSPATKQPVETCNVSLKYIMVNDYVYEEAIELNDKEEKDLYNILSKLEFSSSTESNIEPKYIINYCDTELVISNNQKVIKDNDSVEITKGLEDLLEILKKYEEKINKVYLYKLEYNSISPEPNKEKVNLTEEDKNKLKEIWQNQEKNIEYLDLAIIGNYTLIIDEEELLISKYDKYVYYKDGYIILDEEIMNIINKYMNEDNSSKYTIDNNMSYYNSRYKERGVYYDTLNTPNAPSYYTIASGEKGSGGYSISIEKVNIDDDGNVEVIVKENYPGIYEITTDALTYPICQITFSSAPNNIVFKTEKGEIFKHLNF